MDHQSLYCLWLVICKSSDEMAFFFLFYYVSKYVKQVYIRFRFILTKMCRVAIQVVAD